MTRLGVVVLLVGAGCTQLGDTAGGLECWGSSDNGQLANGAAWRVAPVQVP